MHETTKDDRRKRKTRVTATDVRGQATGDLIPVVNNTIKCFQFNFLKVIGREEGQAQARAERKEERGWKDL